MHVELIEKPAESDWLAVKNRALVTVGKTAVNPPDFEWKRRILEARHSPIRRLHFAFYIECPTWVSVHLCRHVHAQPYVRSQRNDRQSDYDRNKAPQNTPISMIFDVNAEELMVIANKRLCRQAHSETRALVAEMCASVEKNCPEFKGLLVPACEYYGGVCHEMFPCGKMGATNNLTLQHAKIILSYAESGMNKTRIAERLSYHRNTVDYHLSHIKENTGLNPNDFYDLIKLVAMAKSAICTIEKKNSL